MYKILMLIQNLSLHLVLHMSQWHIQNSIGQKIFTIFADNFVLYKPVVFQSIQNRKYWVSVV